LIVANNKGNNGKWNGKQQRKGKLAADYAGAQEAWLPETAAR
jgi:hypothetical protein